MTGVSPHNFTNVDASGPLQVTISAVTTIKDPQQTRECTSQGMQINKIYTWLMYNDYF